jgi:hypothetical protein
LSLSDEKAYLKWYIDHLVTDGFGTFLNHSWEKYTVTFYKQTFMHAFHMRDGRHKDLGFCKVRACHMGTILEVITDQLPYKLFFDTNEKTLGAYVKVEKVILFFTQRDGNKLVFNTIFTMNTKEIKKRFDSGRYVYL